MSFSNIFSEKNKSKYSTYLVFIFFLSFFLLGLAIFRGFGFSIDEPFHRTTGYFWLYTILKDVSPSSEYLIYLKDLLDEMEWSKNFFDGYFHAYGPVFDTFSAVLEQLLGISSDKEVFEFKHLLTFLTFFLSGIYFFKLINERFNSNLFSIILVFIYFTTPRIFAESFYNSKDIIFMSFCVFSIFYYFASYKDNSLKHLILFSLFAALATQIRIMGILLILFYLSFVLWEALEDWKNIKKNYLRIFLTIIFYFIFLYVFWPFLWSDPFTNLIKTFLTFSNYDWGLKVFYLGDYISADNLPWHYVFVWIFVTTPLIYIVFFLLGFINILKVLLKNISSLESSLKNKLWINSMQKKDFFMLFFFLTPIVTVILLNSTLYGGWRHLYFVYPAFIYLVGIGIYYFYSKIREFISNKILFILSILFILHNSYILFKFHPYQNVYFNYLVKNKANKYFEIDYWGLANHEAIEYIVRDSKNNKSKTISIRTASFTPLEYSKKILKLDSARYIFLGTTHSDPDYIFTNYHYEKNPKYQKKYLIPKNYYKVFSINRENVLINSVYKKK